MSRIGQARVGNDRTIRWNALERIVENVHGRVTKSTHQLYFETRKIDAAHICFGLGIVK